MSFQDCDKSQVVECFIVHFNSVINFSEWLGEAVRSRKNIFYDTFYCENRTISGIYCRRYCGRVGLR